MDDVRETLTWESFGDASQELAQEIAGDGFKPDLILAIARGGLFVAGALGYALSVKNLHLMNVEFYNGVGATLDMPVMLPPVPSVVDFSEKKVLIADDVADTGKTPRARARVHRGAGRRGALRRGVREARVAGEVRLRVEAHEPVDQLPVVEPAAGGARGARRLTAGPARPAPPWPGPSRAAAPSRPSRLRQRIHQADLISST